MMHNIHIKQYIPYIVVMALVVIGGAVFVIRKVGPNSASSNTHTGKLPYPLERGAERPKLLRFGMFVTPDPATNPISPPERFTGFHTALDFEIFPEEADVVVPVKTVCDGPVVRADTAEGYGGVIVQSCIIHNQPMTVLYGHVDPASFSVRVSEGVVTARTVIANLAAANSEGSGDTRKHLHLGIHKGNEMQLLGYAQTQQALEEYIDPQPLFE